MKTCNNKNNNYYSFKTHLGGQLETKPGSQVGLTQINARIKVVIIVFLKPNLKVDSEQGLSHE
jgi:hypothetical protein